MSLHPHARSNDLRRRARRLFPRTAVSALALALGLSACAGGSSTPTASSDPKSGMLLKIADETYAGGDPATAASLYRQLHEMSPRDPVPLTRLAAIFMTMQDYRAAIEAYRAALALDANNADLHRGLASALRRARQARRRSAPL
jgi:Tfp pilus assembly protein PilF